jgi:Mg-dependent DNase
MLPEVLRRARAAGVTEFECCGTGPDDWERVAEIARAEDGVSPAFGIHPWTAAFVDIDKSFSSALKKLDEIIEQIPSASVGEIGLDGARSCKNIQVEIFIKQLEIARRHKCGVTLHCVRAAGEMAAILKCRAREIPFILLHAPNISPQEWAEFERLGANVSIGPGVLLPNAAKLRALTRIVPEERLFFETDSPSDASRLCAVSELGGLNAPENIPRIAAAVEALRLPQCG